MRGAVAINEMGDVMAEVVRKWTCGITGRFTVQMSSDFDPATDAVIVVKKDAARVWCEGMERHRYLHTSKPTWRGLEWTDSTSVADIGGLLPCIGNTDCVEFVAVKTYRPPVTQEVAEPVAELSDEAKVKAVYPNAHFSPLPGCIYNGNSPVSTPVSDPIGLRHLAWANAAHKLDSKLRTVAQNATTRPAISTDSIEHLGCGVEVVSGAVLAN